MNISTKERLLIIVLATLVLSNISPQENPTPRYSVGIGETIGYNILQGGFNHYVLNLHFSHISFYTARDNLMSPWVWDFNSFITNHLGHPYQGVIYYTSARSNHFGFYLSSLNTVLGSVTWEYFMENVQPSINDLIITTSGGIVLGEILYRISDTLWNDSNNPSSILLSSLTSPISSINRTVFKDKKCISKKKLLTGKTSAEYDISYGFKISTELEYGDIYSNKLSQPFDYFNFNIGAGFSNTDLLIELFSNGLIWGSSFYLANNYTTRRFLGLFLGVDFIYGIRKLNLGANYAGLGYLQKSSIDRDTFLNIYIFTNFIFMGGTNYNTNDNGLGFYRLGIGENIKSGIELESINNGSFSLNYKYYGLHSVAEKDYKDRSGYYDITGLFDLSIDRDIAGGLRIGSSIYIYHKEKELLGSGLTIYFVSSF